MLLVVFQVGRPLDEADLLLNHLDPYGGLPVLRIEVRDFLVEVCGVKLQGLVAFLNLLLLELTARLLDPERR